MRRYFPAFRFNATTTDEQRAAVRAAEGSHPSGWTASDVSHVCRYQGLRADLFDLAGVHVGYVDDTGKVSL